MFDRYQIVKIHNFLFFWGIFKWAFNEYFINKGASDFCIASNCTGAKKTFKYYFHKPWIDHLESSLFSEGQLYCSHSIKYTPLSCHSCFLTHRFECAVCHYDVVQKFSLCFIWYESGVITFCTDSYSKILKTNWCNISSSHFWLINAVSLLPSLLTGRS